MYKFELLKFVLLHDRCENAVREMAKQMLAIRGLWHQFNFTMWNDISTPDLTGTIEANITTQTSV